MKKANWAIRRRMLFIITAFCMAVIWRGINLPTQSAESGVTMAFYTLIGVMVIYVWGAITDDHIEMFIKSKYGGKANNDYNDN